MHVCTYICTYMQEGATPLMAAVQEDHLEAARVLIRECNCNTNVQASVSCSAHLSCCVSTPAYMYVCAWVFQPGHSSLWKQVIASPSQPVSPLLGLISVAYWWKVSGWLRLVWKVGTRTKLLFVALPSLLGWLGEVITGHQLNRLWPPASPTLCVAGWYGIISSDYNHLLDSLQKHPFDSTIMGIVF